MSTTAPSGLGRNMRRITVGEDITPYLSRAIRDIDYQDGLLSHWGIHHQGMVDDLDNIRARAAASGHSLPELAEFELEMSGDPPCAVEATSRYALPLRGP